MTIKIVNNTYNDFNKYYVVNTDQITRLKLADACYTPPSHCEARIWYTDTGTTDQVQFVTMGEALDWITDNLM